MDTFLSTNGNTGNDSVLRTLALGNDSFARASTSQGPNLQTYLGRPDAVIGPNSTVRSWDFSPALHATQPWLFTVVKGEGGGLARYHGTAGELVAYALDWERQLGEPAGPPNLTRSNDVLFSATDGRLLLIDDVTGNTLWETTGLGAINSSAIVTRDEKLAVNATGRAVTALKLGNGKRGWRTNLAGFAGPVAAAPNGTIVCGDDAGNVYGLSQTTGAILWQTLAGGPVVGSAAFYGSTAYVPVSGEVGGRLIALDVLSGDTLWTRETVSPMNYGPVVGPDGRVYGSAGTKLLAVESGGTLAWEETAGNLDMKQVFLGPLILAPDGSLLVNYLQGAIIFRQRERLEGGSPTTVVGSPSTNTGASFNAAVREKDNVDMIVRGRRLDVRPGEIARVSFRFGGSLVRPGRPVHLYFRSYARHDLPIRRKIIIPTSGGTKVVDNRILASGEWLDQSFNIQPLIGDRSGPEVNVIWSAEGVAEESAVRIDYAAIGCNPPFWSGH